MTTDLRKSLRAMLALALCWASIAFCDMAAAQEALGVPEPFRQAFIDRLTEKAPDVEAEITAEGVTVHGPAGTVRISLENSWRRVVAGEDADTVLAQLVDVALPSGKAKFDPERAFLIVRPRTFMHDFETAPDVADVPLFEPLAGDLVVILGQDLGDRFLYLPRSTIGPEAVMWSGAWDAAEKRTKDAFGDVEFIYAGHGLGFLSAREDITASLLAIDAVWDEDLTKLVGPAIAVIPLKTLLIVANADDPAAMQDLTALMPEVAQDPDGLTGFILIRRDGAWSAISP